MATRSRSAEVDTAPIVTRIPANDPDAIASRIQLARELTGLSRSALVLQALDAFLPREGAPAPAALAFAPDDPPPVRVRVNGRTVAIL